MKTKRKLKFADLPKDYMGLCKFYLPRPIHDKVSLENTTEILDVMAGHESDFSKDQHDYFEVLCELVDAYESQTFKEPKLSSIALLKYLLEEQGMNASDLSRLLKVDRTLGPKILRGDRRLTVEHVRILSQHFKLSADVFL